MTPIEKLFLVIGVIVLAAVLILVSYWNREGTRCEEWKEANERFRFTTSFIVLGAIIVIFWAIVEA